jgi:hypothetical protein
LRPSKIILAQRITEVAGPGRERFFTPGTPALQPGRNKYGIKEAHSYLSKGEFGSKNASAEGASRRRFGGYASSSRTARHRSVAIAGAARTTDDYLSCQRSIALIISACVGRLESRSRQLSVSAQTSRCG